MLFIAENERENELVQKLAKEYSGTAYQREDAYGVTVWSVQDVMSEHPELKEEAARRFLEDNERKLRENNIAGGWDYIQYADFSKYKNIPVEYNGMKIFEKEGLYTVGSRDNADFDDCTLENLSINIDEAELVEFCKEKGIDVLFDDLRNHNGKEVSYEDYTKHLARYETDPDGNFLAEEFIVPKVVFDSFEEAQEFVDLLQEYFHDVSRRIEALQKQAAVLGGTLHFSESDLIDAQHLNCFWYDSGCVAVFEYKDFECSVEVHGDISLAVFDENCENTILVFGKRNGHSAYKDDDVLSIIVDDAGLEALAEQGHLSWGLNNWVELRIFDENNKEIAIHEDNVLENNLLEAIDSLDWFASVVDEICAKREAAKSSLDSKIKSASEKVIEQQSLPVPEKEEVR